MAFCSNCGTQNDGAYCPNCGSSMGSGTRAGSGSVPPGSPTAIQAPGLTENVASALCYTPFFIGLIIDIVMLVVAPYSRNRTIRFHALQSLFLHAAIFVFWIVVHIFLGLFAVMTHGVGFVASLGLYPLISLAIIALFLVMMYKCYNNQKIKLPVIGDLAEKQA